MKTNNNKYYKIQFKSILLDIIERIKTKHRILQAVPWVKSGKLTFDEVYSEKILLQLRKCSFFPLINYFIQTTRFLISTLARYSNLTTSQNCFSRCRSATIATSCTIDWTHLETNHLSKAEAINNPEKITSSQQ